MFCDEAARLNGLTRRIFGPVPIRGGALYKGTDFSADAQAASTFQNIFCGLLIKQKNVSEYESVMQGHRFAMSALPQWTDPAGLTCQRHVPTFRLF